MLSLILSLTLSANPNAFEPKEVSSEDIFAGVAICMDKTLREMPSTGETGAIVMCSCLMDAQRANIRKKQSPDPTSAQQAQCHKIAADRTAPKTKGKSGT